MYKRQVYRCFRFCVAPPVGAWIEIVVYKFGFCHGCFVAPPVGAWIEIFMIPLNCVLMMVAPPVGAWIEIADEYSCTLNDIGRSPRGSVD